MIFRFDLNAGRPCGGLYIGETMNQQQTPEWHKKRIGKITGSRAGAALGINPWMTPEQLLRQMVREYHGAESEFKGNIATEYGNLHEPLAAMDYLGKTGNLVEEVGFVQHPDHEWLFLYRASLSSSGECLLIRCPFNLKNSIKPNFKALVEQPHYYAKAQIEMLCTGRDKAHFYQWCKGGDYLEEVSLDHDWVSSNLPALEAFHKRYLEELDNPEHLQPLVNEINTLRSLDLLNEYDSLKETIDNANARVNEIMAELVDACNESDSIIHGRKMTKIQRKGNIQYGKVPELDGVDLEPYRGKPVEFWKLS